MNDKETDIDMQPRLSILAAIVCVLTSFVLVALVAPAVRVFSVEDLKARYSERGYSRNALFSGEAAVPRLYLASVPAAWDHAIERAEIRKDVFFRTMLPLVLKANEEIAADRTRLLRLVGRIDSAEPLDAGDRQWLGRLAQAYDVIEAQDVRATPPDRETIGRLLRRVDTVPPSLALAQGAIESGYGTSRFAQEGNAIFGEWRYGEGMRPGEARTALGDYRIASFERPLDAVRAYMQNLNTHRAYRAFRSARAELRLAGSPLRGLALAGTLTSYSERGQDYVGLVREVIDANRLGRLDATSLADGPPRRLAWGWF